MFDLIEQLKSQWTDKYVEVTGSHPALDRFRGLTGVVKTVNMSGRALVEFDAWNNMGWYDIEVGFLRQVARPAPKTEEKKAERAASGDKAPAAKPAPSAPAKPKATSDILAAARGGAAAAKPAGKSSTADIIAAARGKTSAAPAGGSGKATEPAAAAAQTTAEILAAARTKKGSAPAAASPAPPEAPPARPAPAAPPAASKPAAGGPRMTVAEMLDWCRQHDAK